MSATFALAALSLFAPGAAAPPRPAAASAEQIKAAIARSIPLLEKSRTEYLDSRRCFSCHHQAVPTLALTLARERGFAVNANAFQTQLDLTVKELTRRRSFYLKGIGPGGDVDNSGHALWLLELAGHKADKTTAAVSEYLLLRHRALDYWRTPAQRPPSMGSNFTTTYLALRGLSTFADDSQKERVKKRVEKVRAWLLRTPARDTEDRVFRLGALKYAGATPQQVATAARELLESQRADGGWAQRTSMNSDAYATGSALVMLHEVGGLTVEQRTYVRGLKFLVDGQLKDGSWHVKTRARPIQRYFESGFPHRRDQFISVAATGWATAALLLACPPRETAAR